MSSGPTVLIVLGTAAMLAPLHPSERELVLRQGIPASESGTAACSGSLSSDGRFVAFVSTADLLPAGTRSGADVYDFAPLTSLDWQVHIFGEAIPEIRALCAEHHRALHEFAWQRAMTRAGLERDALYLVRPDGYVALAATEQSPVRLGAYLNARGIRLRPRP